MIASAYTYSVANTTHFLMVPIPAKASAATVRTAANAQAGISEPMAVTPRPMAMGHKCSSLSP